MDVPGKFHNVPEGFVKLLGKDGTKRRDTKTHL